MVGGLHINMKRAGRSQCLLLLLALTIPCVAGLLQEPKISVSKYMELGRGEVATCDVPNRPDSESLLINMYLDSNKLSTTQTRAADSEIAQTIISPTQPGKFVLACSVSDDKDTKLANATFTVYNFPDPILDIQEDVEDEHSLSIICRLPNVRPTTVSINIEAKSSELNCPYSNKPTERTCSLPSIKEHNGLEVVCKASMSGLEQNMTKSTKTNLDIEYPPEFNDSKCPLNQTLVEGTSDLVLCAADGNPEPSVVCVKDGEEYKDGQLPRVTRAHAGLYRCKARNKLDNNVREVTVSVQLYNSAYFIRTSSGLTVSMLALTVLVLQLK